MTEQERLKQAEKLNKTPLSQEVAKLVSKQYLAEHELILTAALAEFLDEMIPQEPTGIWSYQMETAREVLESLTSWIGIQKYSPRDLYKYLTTTEETDDWTEMELLKLIQTKDPETWKLGTVGQELMSNLSVWFNLNP